jgi:hypothetical protein
VFLAAAAIALASLLAAFAIPREQRDNVPEGNG